MATHISKTELIRLNTEHWALASFYPSALAQAKKVAERLVAPKAKMIYLQVEQATGVPWWVVAVCHEREAGQRWDRQLGQGDPLHEVSRHVPKGRGPFSTFIEGAIDALNKCPPFLGQWKDWTPGGALTATELYNGTGYEDYHHMASPYVWGGSAVYHVGKYVADGNFDATVEDHQLGTAVLLKAMMELDPDVQFHAKSNYVEPLPPAKPERAGKADEGPARDQPPASEPAPEPVGPKPTAQEQDLPKPMHKSKIGWLSSILSFFGLGGVMNSINDATLDTVTEAVSTVHDKADQVKHLSSQIGLGHILANAASKPMTYIFLGIVVSGLAILYFRWRDHGRGAVQ